MSEQCDGLLLFVSGRCVKKEMREVASVEGLFASGTGETSEM